MIWLNIRNYEGEYQISDKGYVRRISGRGCHIVKSCKSANGRHYITLWKNGKRRSFALHKLYADAFGVSEKCSIKILYEGYKGDLEAKDRVRKWLINKISDCEENIQDDKNINDEIRYLKSFLRQLNE